MQYITQEHRLLRRLAAARGPVAYEALARELGTVLDEMTDVASISQSRACAKCCILRTLSRLIAISATSLLSNTNLARSSAELLPTQSLPELMHTEHPYKYAIA